MCRRAKTRLDHPLIDLVKTRASQINACAYCIHMHTDPADPQAKDGPPLWGNFGQPPRG
jgi:alkylhydroperoxidase family enzyme